jgi:hypothetical protein
VGAEVIAEKLEIPRFDTRIGARRLDVVEHRRILRFAEEWLGSGPQRPEARNFGRQIR